MGSFFEHFIGSNNVSSNLTIECDYNGLEYLSFSIDGQKYSANDNNALNMNEYHLFDHHYNTITLHGYDKNDNHHKFQATIDLDWGMNHNKLIDLIEID